MEYREATRRRLAWTACTVVAVLMAIGFIGAVARGATIGAVVFGSATALALVARWVTRFEPWD